MPYCPAPWRLSSWRTRAQILGAVARRRPTILDLAGIVHRSKGAPMTSNDDRDCCRFCRSPMPVQKRLSGRCRRHHRDALLGRTPRDIAAIERFLPHGKPRTGGAPYLDHLTISARMHCDPFDEVEHQRIKGRFHGHSDDNPSSTCAISPDTVNKMRAAERRSGPQSRFPDLAGDHRQSAFCSG